MAIGLALPGRPPRTDDPVVEVTRTLLDHRSAFLWGTYLTGVSAVLLLLFLGAVRARVGGELGAAAFGSGLVAVALVMAGAATIGGLAFTAAGMHDPAVVRALLDAGNAQIAMAGLAFAGLLVAGSTAAGLPKPLALLGYAGAAYLVATRVTLAVDSGPFQSGNPIDLASTVMVAAWVAGFSVLLVRERKPAPS